MTRGLCLINKTRPRDVICFRRTWRFLKQSVSQYVLRRKLSTPPFPSPLLPFFSARNHDLYRKHFFWSMIFSSRPDTFDLLPFLSHHHPSPRRCSSTSINQGVAGLTTCFWLLLLRPSFTTPFPFFPPQDIFNPSPPERREHPCFSQCYLSHFPPFFPLNSPPILAPQALGRIDATPGLAPRASFFLVPSSSFCLRLNPFHPSTYLHCFRSNRDLPFERTYFRLS